MKSKSIRLTSTSYALLALLDQLGEATPYEIKQAMDKSIQNFWPVPHTTAYNEPARLAEGGFLSVHQEEGGRRRKTYSLTEEGRAALAAWAADPVAAPPQVRDETILKIFAGADPASFLEPRRTYHREKLAELQGYLDEVREDDAWHPSELALTAGVAYHRKMLEMLDELSQPG
jgi:DNA-binding PadR family transcriptional regulator